jgi:hypothetical protein
MLDKSMYSWTHKLNIKVLMLSHITTSMYKAQLQYHLQGCKRTGTDLQAYHNTTIQYIGAKGKANTEVA